MTSPSIIQFPRILILLLLISAGNFSGMIITPSLPQIAIDFEISEKLAQWTMSIFLIGYAVGQLPYGPIANRFGRKKAISIGLLIAFLGTLMAYAAPSFWVLCLARFIQALGASVGLKVAFTMVGDRHAGASATKAISTLTLAFGVMPGIATFIGGNITPIWGWQGSFLFLSFYLFVLWLLCLFLPETSKELQKDALNMDKISSGLARQMKDPFIFLHAFLAGLTSAAIYIFATLSPYISIQKIGLSPEQFGLFMMVPTLGICSGVLVSRHLSSRLNPRLNMLSGILIFLVSSLIMTLCFANQYVTIWSLFIPTYFLYIGCNVIWSNACSKGLSEATDKSNASAVIQFFNIATAVIGVFLVGTISPLATMLLPAAFGLITLLLFGTWLKLKAHHS